MANKKSTDAREAETQEAETTEAFVLLDCAYGKLGEVVTLPLEQAAAGVTAGVLDTQPGAVAAAKASND